MVDDDNGNAINKFEKNSKAKIIEPKHVHNNNSHNVENGINLKLYLCDGVNNTLSNQNGCEDVRKLLTDTNKNAVVSEFLSISKNTKNTISVAKRRWKILAKALCNRNNVCADKSVRKNESTIAASINRFTADDYYLASVRRFGSFDLFQRVSFVELDETFITCGSTANWCIYRMSIGSNYYSAFIHYINQSFTPDDLIGFNNTGNVCVWPSEEALAYYSVSNLVIFRNKRVLELGGGMTCLASLFIAKYAGANCVHLTDGNSLSMENVRTILDQNRLSVLCNAHCSLLNWENIENANGGQFDYILSADCLFFDNARMALVNALWHLLTINGCALIMAPYRGKTLNSFVEQATGKGFCCNIVKCYSDTVWQRHLHLKQFPFYDEDIHYPILIELTKIPKLITTH